MDVYVPSIQTESSYIYISLLNFDSLSVPFMVLLIIPAARFVFSQPTSIKVCPMPITSCDPIFNVSKDRKKVQHLKSFSHIFLRFIPCIKLHPRQFDQPSSFLDGSSPARSHGDKYQWFQGELGRFTGRKLTHIK